MDFCKISHDMKLAIPPYECGFSQHTWYQILKVYKETDNVVNQNISLCGHICLLERDNVALSTKIQITL